MVPVARIVPPPALRHHSYYLPLQPRQPGGKSSPFIFNPGTSCPATGAGISLKPPMRVHVASFGFTLARSHRFSRRSARLLPHPAWHHPSCFSIHVRASPGSVRSPAHSSIHSLLAPLKPHTGHKHPATAPVQKYTTGHPAGLLPDGTIKPQAIRPATIITKTGASLNNPFQFGEEQGRGFSATGCFKKPSFFLLNYFCYSDPGLKENKLLFFIIVIKK